MTKVYVTRTGAVAELVISAPPLNLFDGELITDLGSALDELIALTADRAARAVLLRAEGKVFCGGVDVHEFEGLSPAQGAVLMARFLALVQTLERLPVPTLAVVHALNLTIGFELCLGCDLLWAADDASFGLVEATVGLTPGGGGTQRLVARAGVARAAELVMTGDVYHAAELHQWGVVNRVVASSDLLERARSFAARLAAGPTAATAVGKRLLAAARDHGVAAADAVTPRETGQVFATRDLPAGIASLLTRGPRQARFEGC
ncbi:MAG: enoyl-CoA hydratase/isomerase family protein [Actinobacteria bacterium]|nr:enoyl-CoA hydratase/isomerase family protein [Actinomycetota bacterium]